MICQSSCCFKHFASSLLLREQATYFALANLDKSHIYLGGIRGHEKDRMLSTLQIPEGDFPFRRGSPLSTKKLTYNQCRPLIDKVTARAKVWTARHLAYAGRLQLVKSILQSLQSKNFAPMA